VCIAILKPAKRNVSNRHIRNAWNNNPHGGGFMYAHDGHIHIHKELSSVNAFIKAFRAAEHAHPTAHFVLHMRIMTSGLVDEANTHPFRIDEHVAFCHNGVIDIELDDKLHSDTWAFNEHVLRKLPDAWYDSAALRELIRGYIGASKLIFLRSDNKTTLINEGLGHWSNGVWYSNHSHEYAYTTQAQSQYGAGWKTWGDYDADNRYGVYNGGYEYSHNAKTPTTTPTPTPQAEWNFGVCNKCAVPLINKRERTWGVCAYCLDKMRIYDSELHYWMKRCPNTHEDYSRNSSSSSSVNNQNNVVPLVKTEQKTAQNT